MNLLCIDTTGPALVLALTTPGGDVHGHVLETAGKHAEVLLPGVAALLAAHGLTARSVDAIGVTLGPGGFTSVRVGLATAKGLCVAAGRALYGVSSLRALAYVARPTDDAGRAHMAGGASSAGGAASVAVVSPAYRGEVYAALYSFEEPSASSRPSRGGGVIERVAPFHAGPADALDTLTRAAEGERPGARIVVGMTHLERLGGDAVSEAARALWTPYARDALSPAALAASLLEEVHAGRIRDVATLAPEYLRPPDAALPRG